MFRWMNKQYFRPKLWDSVDNVNVDDDDDDNDDANNKRGQPAGCLESKFQWLDFQ